MNQLVRYPTREASMSGTRMPRWFGYAWYRINVDQEVWMIIPLNYIVSWARRIYYTLRAGAGPTEIDQAYRDGYARGCKDTGDNYTRRISTVAERAWERATRGESW